jgi:ketosteroid isomerase-like protein
VFRIFLQTRPIAGMAKLSQKGQLLKSQMKNNISVFILLILVACSFKYRAKTSGIVHKEAAQKESLPLRISDPGADLVKVISFMQDGNLQLARGNAEQVKQLWSHSDDVTIFCESGGVEVNGWRSVAERLDWVEEQIPDGSTYTFETISSQAGNEYGSLQQTEHYRSPNGKTTDLGVTVLFKKESDGWKIIHRRAEHLSSGIASR